MDIQSYPAIDFLLIEAHKLKSQAEELALKELEKLARNFLRKYPDYKEFVMGMGVWSVRHNAGGNYCHRDSRYHDVEPELMEIGEFIDYFEYQFDNTFCGNPMRFTAEGPVITDW